MKILISAYNINSGGGKFLLESLLDNSDGLNVTVFSDIRFKEAASRFSAHKNIKFEFVGNSLIQRILAEMKISKIAGEFDKHFCFGNLPPLFKSKAKETSVYLHSRYMLDKSFDAELPLRKLLITLLERTWFRFGMDKTIKVFVQTPTMKSLFENQFPENKAEVAPFFPALPASNRTSGKKFLYVASVDPHKNHEKLILAWKLLGTNAPELTLVISAPSVSLESLLKINNSKNISLTVNKSRDELSDIYASHSCLIHPSVFESFGMVLVEARQAGMDIIAPEADYVRDVVVPKETFDPHSEVSIARAVQRYLGIQNDEMKILSPGEFWKKI